MTAPGTNPNPSTPAQTGDPSTAPTTPPAQSTPAQPAGTAPEGSKPEGDKPLGPAGERALQAERDARRALEKQLADLKPVVDFVTQIRGGAGTPESQKTEAEKMSTQLAELQKTVTEEREQRFRLEVATEKGLTAAQATWLRGSTKDELAASADQLLASFPAPAAGTAPAGQPATPGTPRPDPSQGARGAVDLAAQIKAAEEKGDRGLAIRLKAQQLRPQNRPTA